MEPETKLDMEPNIESKIEFVEPVLPSTLKIKLQDAIFEIKVGTLGKCTAYLNGFLATDC